MTCDQCEVQEAIPHFYLCLDCYNLQIGRKFKCNKCGKLKLKRNMYKEVHRRRGRIDVYYSTCKHCRKEIDAMYASIRYLRDKKKRIKELIG